MATHYLADERQPLTTSLDETSAGETEQAFPRKTIDDELANKEHDGIRLNIWDFGGQEIMHSTHQFFLSKRSVYILMIDARAGERESNLHYWLEMIGVYGGNSPVLIVVNKCDGHFEDLDETRLKIDYRSVVNIMGVAYVSCLTGHDIDLLRGKITELVVNLPHVSDEVPEDYFLVKDALEKEAKRTDFLAAKEYQALCRKFDVRDDAEQIRLLRFLHDLGCVLHYDDPSQIYRLHDTRVLNPEWVTGSVYRILNDPDLMRRADGLLSMADLKRILQADTFTTRRYPAERHGFVIDLMRKYELCVEVPDKPRLYLVPELLPRNEPDVGWIDRASGLGNVLDFEYHYRVLPRGLIPRLIVRAELLLSERRTYWRSGTVLTVEGCRALVRGDTRVNRVHIQVQGDGDRRRALAVLRNCFDSVHRTYGNLGVQSRIPLPMDPGAPAVDYEHLQKLERDGVVELRFEGSEHPYHVAALLSGIDERKYDVFLSYNRRDKIAARRLWRSLARLGIRCWMDEYDLRPGRPWQLDLAEALRMSKAIAVLIGASGAGPWQAVEVQLGLLQAIEHGKPVIPVLFPGSCEPKLWDDRLAFLRALHSVDARAGLKKQNIVKIANALRGS